MNSYKIGDALLTLLGLTALGVYVLACRPSVSPDGSKVVFPVVDEKAKENSIVLYDRNKGTTEKLFVPARDEEDFFAYSAQWMPDGKQVLINGTSYIMILPVGSSNPTRFFMFKDKVDDSSIAIPPPVIGRYQFLAGKSVHPPATSTTGTNRGENSQPVILRVDLETGQTLTAPAKGECFLTGHGGQVYYIVEAGEGDEKGYEIGRLDPDKLTQIPSFKLKEKDSGELMPFLALTKDGSRLAMAGKLEDVQHILLYRGNTLEKTVVVAAKGSGVEIGQVEWAANESTLYAVFARKLGEDEKRQYGIMEVPINGGSGREITLFTGTDKDIWMAAMQIVLSPSGREIFTSSVCFGADTVNPEDRALYLVDVSSPKLTVTKVAVPFSSGSQTGARKHG